MKWFIKKRPAVAFSILQQRSTIGWGAGSSPVYLPGKMLEKQTASNMYKALDVSMPSISARNLKAAKDKVDWLFFGGMGDSMNSRSTSRSRSRSRGKSRSKSVGVGVGVGVRVGVGVWSRE